MIKEHLKNHNQNDGSSPTPPRRLTDVKIPTNLIKMAQTAYNANKDDRYYGQAHLSSHFFNIAGDKGIFSAWGEMVRRHENLGNPNTPAALKATGTLVEGAILATGLKRRTLHPSPFVASLAVVAYLGVCNAADEDYTTQYRETIDKEAKDNGYDRYDGGGSGSGGGGGSDPWI